MNNSSSLPRVILGDSGHAQVLIAALYLTNRNLLSVVSPDLVKGSECLGIKYWAMMSKFWISIQ